MVDEKARGKLTYKSLLKDTQLISKISIKDIPEDKIMKVLRKAIEPRLSYFLADKKDILIDPSDLKYQTLFRLTSYDVTDLFHNGGFLKKIMIERGYYSSWLNITRLDERIVSSFEVNTGVIDSAINEQYDIITHRLSKSKLPLDEILNKSEVSSANGWYIHKRDGELFAAKGRHSYINKDIRKINLKSVDINYANRVFNDLHYIHTPRATEAVGLFFENEDIPFSVAGFAPVDRSYKKNILSAYGYNSDKCWEFVRLYSKPNAPMNTSSSFLSGSIKFLSVYHPDTEAYISAFTPSFASGKSMIAGGFDDVVLAKNLKLKFGDATIHGKYERLTNRRLESYSGSILENKLPVLPTLELVRSMNKSEKLYGEFVGYTVII
jgi:hypothetical protein